MDWRVGSSFHQMTVNTVTVLLQAQARVGLARQSMLNMSDKVQEVCVSQWDAVVAMNMVTLSELLQRTAEQLQVAADQLTSMVKYLRHTAQQKVAAVDSMDEQWYANAWASTHTTHTTHGGPCSIH